MNVPNSYMTRKDKWTLEQNPRAGAWQCKWSCQAVCCRIGPVPKSSGLASGGAKCLAKRFGTRFHLETLEMRQAVTCAVRGCIGGFYTTLDESLKTMTCWGPFTSCSLY